jgi:hypothetical protein
MKLFFKTTLIGVLILMGCKEDSIALDALKQQFCVQDAPFPATTPLAPEDAAIQAKYGTACSNISRLTGLKFKHAKQAYLCRSSLVGQGLEVKEAIPRASLLALFSEADINGSDLLTRYGFTGVDFAAIIFDANAKPILTSTALKTLIASVDSAEGAMAWAYLQGVLGAGYQPQALCNATSITEGGSGWSVEKAEKIISCKPTKWVSFTVNRVGVISITRETDKVNPDGTKTVICVD